MKVIPSMLIKNFCACKNGYLCVKQAITINRARTYGEAWVFKHSVEQLCFSYRLSKRNREQASM